MKKYLIDLQLFADDDSAGKESEGNGGNDQAPPKDSDGKVKDSPAGDLKYTDADVDRIIEKKFAQKMKDWEARQQKAVDEAKKLEQMNASEKMQHELDKFQKELEEYKKKDLLAEMSRTARKMLADQNLNVGDEILSLLVSEDADSTKAAVDNFTTLFKDAVEKAVKEHFKGEPPSKGSAPGKATMTREEISKIRDPELRQKAMLENKELYTQFK